MDKEYQGDKPRGTKRPSAFTREDLENICKDVFKVCKHTIGVGGSYRNDETLDLDYINTPQASQTKEQLIKELLCVDNMGRIEHRTCMMMADSYATINKELRTQGFSEQQSWAYTRTIEHKARQDAERLAAIATWLSADEHLKKGTNYDHAAFFNALLIKRVEIAAFIIELKNRAQSKEKKEQRAYIQSSTPLLDINRALSGDTRCFIKTIEPTQKSATSTIIINTPKLCPCGKAA